MSGYRIMASFKSLSINSGNSTKRWLKQTMCREQFNQAQQLAASGRRMPFPWLLRRHAIQRPLLCSGVMRLYDASFRLDGASRKNNGHKKTNDNF